MTRRDWNLTGQPRWRQLAAILGGALLYMIATIARYR